MYWPNTQVFDGRFRITKTEFKEHVAQLVLDQESAKEGDIDTLGDEELKECHVEEFSTAAESGMLSDLEDTRVNITEATEATDAAQPRR